MIWRLTLRHLLSKPFSAFLTVVAVAACISLLGIFWSVIENLEQVSVTQTNITSNSNSVPALTVFLDSKLPKSRVDSIRNALLQQKTFKSVEAVPAEAAVRLFEQQFGETFSKTLTQNSLPLTLKLQFHDVPLQRENYNRLLNEIRATEGVLDLDDGTNLLPASDTQLKSRVFTWASALLLLVFLVVSLLISHLIRIVFETTRSEVETMKVLGAPLSWMFLPLLIEGLLFGLVGTTFAIAVVSATIKILIPRFAASLLPKGIHFIGLSWTSTFQLIAIGILASLVGALMTWPLVKQPPTEI